MKMTCLENYKATGGARSANKLPEKKVIAEHKINLLFFCSTPFSRVSKN